MLFAPLPHVFAMDEQCGAHCGDLLTALRADVPRLALREDEACAVYVLEVNAPGVRAKDVKIEATPGGTLRVCGQTTVAAGTHTHFVDYTIALPKEADVENATASASDGILLISLPKKEAEPVKRVPIATTPIADPESDEDEIEPRPHVVTIQAAGIPASELSIEVKSMEGLFKVEGKSARSGRKLLKCFRLPRDAADDVESWHASHVDGLLTLIIPKKAAPTPMGIPVTTGRDADGAPCGHACGEGEEQEEEEEEGVMV